MLYNVRELNEKVRSKVKLVKVHTLKQGDHFVFYQDIKDKNPYVYVVTDVDVSKWAECVHSDW